ncbi:hypothetical protein QN219_29810 [Sinorhizobium sp. 7-81]|uniref:hypothetical protein n=1 Tax=Sinorhizobium sp. 8-89 TaxID=3049089 RepID=UPI0024C3AA22|nr:hypothetical protein [Sinorhizobium sp. 8-89]MDK1494167.1 hypothetical protein [Sinorhizobium sp. 8-89]
MQQRYLWGVALVCIIDNGPMNSQFVSKSIPPDRVAAVLSIRLMLHAVRIVLGLIASAMGVIAVYLG